MLRHDTAAFRISKLADFEFRIDLRIFSKFFFSACIVNNNCVFGLSCFRMFPNAKNIEHRIRTKIRYIMTE